MRRSMTATAVLLAGLGLTVGTAGAAPSPGRGNTAALSGDCGGESVTWAVTPGVAFDDDGRPNIIHKASFFAGDGVTEDSGWELGSYRPLSEMDRLVRCDYISPSTGNPAAVWVDRR